MGWLQKGGGSLEVIANLFHKVFTFSHGVWIVERYSRRRELWGNLHYDILIYFITFVCASMADAFVDVTVRGA